MIIDYSIINNRTLISYLTLSKKKLHNMSLIDRIDMFAVPITLYSKNKLKHGSHCGALCSILIFVWVIIYTVGLFLEFNDSFNNWQNNDKLSQLRETSEADLTDYIIQGKESLVLAYKLDSSYTDSDRYFKV